MSILIKFHVKYFPRDDTIKVRSLLLQYAKQVVFVTKRPGLPAWASLCLEYIRCFRRVSLVHYFEMTTQINHWHIP
jgi:hypothetical protein